MFQINIFINFVTISVDPLNPQWDFPSYSFWNMKKVSTCISVRDLYPCTQKIRVGTQKITFCEIPVRQRYFYAAHSR